MTSLQSLNLLRGKKSLSRERNGLEKRSKDQRHSDKETWIGQKQDSLLYKGYTFHYSWVILGLYYNFANLSYSSFSFHV